MLPILFISFFVMLFIAVPIAFAMAGSAILALVLETRIPLTLVVQRIYAGGRFLSASGDSLFYHRRRDHDGLEDDRPPDRLRGRLPRPSSQRARGGHRHGLRHLCRHLRLGLRRCRRHRVGHDPATEGQGLSARSGRRHRRDRGRLGSDHPAQPADDRLRGHCRAVGRADVSGRDRAGAAHRRGAHGRHPHLEHPHGMGGGIRPDGRR